MQDIVSAIQYSSFRIHRSDLPNLSCGRLRRPLSFRTFLIVRCGPVQPTSSCPVVACGQVFSGAAGRRPVAGAGDCRLLAAGSARIRNARAFRLAAMHVFHLVWAPLPVLRHDDRLGAHAARPVGRRGGSQCGRSAAGAGGNAGRTLDAGFGNSRPAGARPTQRSAAGNRGPGGHGRDLDRLAAAHPARLIGRERSNTRLLVDNRLTSPSRGLAHR